MAFKIEKGIPVPDKRTGAQAKYPWSEMEPEDSFEVLLTETRWDSLDLLQRRLLTAGNAAARTRGWPGVRTEVNRDKTGVRVWRIK